MALLEVRDLHVSFGGVSALRGVDLSVEPGTIHGLIGPNGAGKTTLLNCIGRVIRPSQGSVNFDGRDLLNEAPHRLAQLGISRTFQNLALMGERSVLDNVRLGTDAGHLGLADFFPTPSRAQREREQGEAALAALRTIGLEQAASAMVSSLPYGHRKSLEIARAMCRKPRLLMLDEPTAGLHPSEMDGLAGLVLRLRDELRITLLIITHHLEFLARIADEVTVLDLGEVIASGEPGLVHTDERVRAAYLGQVA